MQADQYKITQADVGKTLASLLSGLTVSTDLVAVSGQATQTTAPLSQSSPSRLLDALTVGQSLGNVQQQSSVNHATSSSRSPSGLLLALVR